MRVAGTMAGIVAIGFDMAAVLQMADALGIPARLVTEIFPKIEPLVTAALNRVGQGDG